MLLVAFVLMWGEVSIKAALDRFSNGLMPSFLPRATALNGINVPGLHNLIHAHSSSHAGAGARTPPFTPSTG
jgi:hypothetical protein